MNVFIKGVAMPKILENVKSAILKEAEKELLEGGYAYLNVRKVAAACHISIGTVYNYYESKMILVAAVILNDWKDLIKNIEMIAIQAHDVMEGLQEMGTCVRLFEEKYASTWRSYSPSSRDEIKFKERYSLVRNQLKEQVGVLLNRLQVKPMKNLDLFLAEIVLMTSKDDELTFEGIFDIMINILKEEKHE